MNKYYQKEPLLHRVLKQHLVLNELRLRELGQAKLSDAWTLNWSDNLLIKFILRLQLINICNI